MDEEHAHPIYNNKDIYDNLKRVGQKLFSEKLYKLYIQLELII